MKQKNTQKKIILGFKEEEILLTSAKTGEGVAEMFNNITKGTIDKIFNESQNQSILEDRKQIFSYLDDATIMKKEKHCCM